jgi:hypothetical protein
VFLWKRETVFFLFPSTLARDVTTVQRNLRCDVAAMPRFDWKWNKCIHRIPLSALATVTPRPSDYECLYFIPL